MFLFAFKSKILISKGKLTHLKVNRKWYENLESLKCINTKLWELTHSINYFTCLRISRLRVQIAQKSFYCPQKKLREGNAFRGVCLSRGELLSWGVPSWGCHPKGLLSWWVAVQEEGFMKRIPWSRVPWKVGFMKGGSVKGAINGELWSRCHEGTPLYGPQPGGTHPTGMPSF